MSNSTRPSPKDPGTTRAKRDAFRYTPAYGLSPRAPTEGNTPRSVETDSLHQGVFMQTETRPVPQDPAQVARAAIATKRAAHQRISAPPKAIGTQAADVPVVDDRALGDGEAPPPTTDAMIGTRILTLETDIAALQRDAEVLRRTLTHKCEELSLWHQLQQCRAVTDAKET